MMSRAAILGDDYNYESSDGNYYVGDTKWHSDKEPLDPIASFKIAFYLDPVTRDTGCLRVIPGSAFGGDPFAAALHEAVPFTTNSRPEEFWGVSGSEVPAYAIESIPGDMLLFNHRIKHSSWGGGDRRRMFTLNLQQRFADAGSASSSRGGRCLLQIPHRWTRGRVRRGHDPHRRPAPDEAPRAAHRHGRSRASTLTARGRTMRVRCTDGSPRLHGLNPTSPGAPRSS